METAEQQLLITEEQIVTPAIEILNFVYCIFKLLRA